MITMTPLSCSAVGIIVKKLDCNICKHKVDLGKEESCITDCYDSETLAQFNNQVISNEHLA